VILFILKASYDYTWEESAIVCARSSQGYHTDSMAFKLFGDKLKYFDREDWCNFIAAGQYDECCGRVWTQEQQKIFKAQDLATLKNTLKNHAEIMRKKKTNKNMR